ncbi:hypothetical protein JW711_02805 [Candidatus Woesearchaeota archaeon]|nr:hypothetical protein [Candidatus Woesearchaeota archaeon]
MNALTIVIVLIIITPAVQAAVCGDGICEGRDIRNDTGYNSGWPENWDNCPQDCGIQEYARNVGDTYHTKEEVEQILIELVEAHPTIAGYEVIGKSLKGKDILLFKMGNPNGGRFMFDGQMHGAEDCGTETGLKFFQWALESNDPEAQAIREGNQLLFIPIINRDEYRRQNARESYTLEDGTIIEVASGVDLNRNFGPGWDDIGSADPQNTYYYKGIKAASEPETLAVMKAISRYKPEVYFNGHCALESLQGHGNSQVSSTIMEQIRQHDQDYGTITIQTYNPSFNADCDSTGTLCDVACQQGASSWAFEISEWGNMPKNLEEYQSKWYDTAAPAYRAAAKSVQRTEDYIIREISQENEFKFFYGIHWRGDPCENIAYAKNMGYKYLIYQSGMKGCSNADNISFYVESPDQADVIYVSLEGESRTEEEAREISKKHSIKSDLPFPNNLARGWFINKSSFRVVPDLQQQTVIDEIVQESLQGILEKENKNKGFLFAGYVWDVPQMDGDFWTGYQPDGGLQTTISYWTGTNSGFPRNEEAYDYNTYRDGKAAFYKNLITETSKAYPDMKMIYEPWHIYNSWISQVEYRQDYNYYRGDLICQESPSRSFIEDTRIYPLYNYTTNDVCSTTPNVGSHQENLELMGLAAENEAWFGWYGRFGGTGDAPDYKSIREVPPRLQLIRVIAGWENINQVPLSARSFDPQTLTYKSSLSFADQNIMYSVHPRNHKTYAVFLNRNEGIDLKGMVPKSIKLADSLFSPSEDVDSHFQVSAGKLFLTDQNYEGKGFIIELMEAPFSETSSTNAGTETTNYQGTETTTGSASEGSSKGSGGGGSIPSFPYCGNKKCDGEETCISCSNDCGNCPEDDGSLTSSLSESQRPSSNAPIEIPISLTETGNIDIIQGKDDPNHVGEAQITGMAVHKTAKVNDSNKFPITISLIAIPLIIAAFSIMIVSFRGKEEPRPFIDFAGKYPEHALKLEEYYLSSVRQGMRKEEIRHNLLRVGWPATIIDSAMQEISILPHAEQQPPLDFPNRF